MKKLSILATIALSAAFIPLKAPAKDMILIISGTIMSESTNVVYSTNTEFTTSPVPIKQGVITMAFNNKKVYSLISNAVADAYGTLGPSIARTNLPPDGYIAFNSTKTAGGPPGVFYVTNKSGFYYPLSGLNATNGFYSFIELDTFVIDKPGTGGFVIGFGDNSTDVASYSLNNRTANGSGTGTSTGTLFIHDNPYVNDDLDNPNRFFSGSGGFSDHNAIEIRGIVTTKIQYTNAVPMLTSFSLTGSGNCLINEAEYLSLVSNGKATLSP